ncbi:MAG: precorrin-6A reductase [Candidatus Atribacteria bacterium]|nr:precorrin-6A reductase [Candidatus Atribacteria bacterium]
MYKICVFAGTTEGRKLVEFLSLQPVAITACVATEYGETLLSPADNLTILSGRLPLAEIIRILSNAAFDLVIDATHPYAASITESISTACHTTGTEYLRLLREASELSSDAVYVPDTETAVKFLDGTEGNILLTIGSKELAKFSKLANFADRIYARVLPMNASLEACNAADLKASHIIAMQGPFSEEMNLAMLRAVSASWLVSKDGGEAGRFDAKVSAALKAGVRLVVIGRPSQKEGISFSETIELLCSRFGCSCIPYVYILGIGPGSCETMTKEVYRVIKGADCLIGAKRMLEEVATPNQRVYYAISSEDIADFILTHREYRRFAVVMSGDTGFFSGTKKLIPLLDSCKVEVLPGLSSLVYLCARLKTSYEDIFVTSVHGRQHNIVPDVRSHSRVFVLVGGENGMRELCRSLVDAGLGSVQISIGERLSYPDEKITRGTVEHITDGSYETLSVALIENNHPDAVVTHGLPDSIFQRGAGADGVVPMTKSEVRAVCLSKLQLTERSICWDVGAGTGSVAIEMALQAKKGQVYAIEHKSAAVELLHLNKEKFATENLTVISGYAPEVCFDLPTPSHAFIGGSSGNMRGILNLLLEKNPSIRIVATAISLESIAELTACLKEFPWTETEVISIQVAYNKKAGPYHLMTGRNPIYIFTMQAGSNE